MSATNELRELLDRRGVKWWPDVYYKDTNTCWRVGDFEWRASEKKDGKLLIGSTCTKHLTPEQAIEATVSSEMCKITYERKCSECGAYISDNASMYRVPVGDDCFTVKSRRPNFCPNCGRRVV